MIIFLYILSCLTLSTLSHHANPNDDDFAHSVIVDPDKSGPVDDSAEIATVKGEDGDVVLNPDQLAEPGQYRNALANSRYYWPNGVIPYEFASSFRYASVIKAAVADYTKFTCVRWVPRTTERYYIQFQSGNDGCWSYLGYNRRAAQPISLGKGCGRKGIACHEMMHALGFDHEQNRVDRNDHVQIMSDNVKDGLMPQFSKLSRQADLGEKYDYKSVMHYGRNFFAKNYRLNTIEVIDKDMTPSERTYTTNHLGQRLGLSDVDIREINKLYHCPSTSETTTTTTSTTSTSTSTTTTVTTTPRIDPPTTEKKTDTTSVSADETTKKDVTPAIDSTQKPTTNSPASSSSCTDNPPSYSGYCKRFGTGDNCGDPHIGFVLCRKTCGNCASDVNAWRNQASCADSSTGSYCNTWKRGCTEVSYIERGQRNWISYRSRCRQSCGFCGDSVDKPTTTTLSPTTTEQGACPDAYSACTATHCSSWWTRRSCAGTCNLPCKSSNG